MLPLKDKTVLITRSANQVSDFINQLHHLGAKTLTLPLIENTAINQTDLIEKVTHTNYDWIIFTSVNAVRFFFESISSKTISSKIAVVGEKTNQFLNEIGIASDFTPSQFTAKHLANEIPISANDKILIPRSDLAKHDIVELLEARNCMVDPISIYANKSISYSQNEIENIFNQKIDYITFTSGSIVTSFINLGITLKDEQLICIGPETAKIAEENGLRVTAIANPHTIEGMVEAILEN